MKVAVFGTALLACTIPAFAQIETTVQPIIPGNCEAAFISPGVPSSIVVIPVPAPALPAGDVLGSGSSLRPRGRVRPGYVTSFPGRSSPTPAAGGIGSGIGAGIGSVSGIGMMVGSGIGSMGTSGVGSMSTSGIGSMTASGIGSFGATSFDLPARATSSSLAVAAPLRQSPPLGSSSLNAHLHPPVPQQRLPFICP